MRLLFMLPLVGCSQPPPQRTATIVAGDHRHDPARLTGVVWSEAGPASFDRVELALLNPQPGDP